MDAMTCKWCGCRVEGYPPCSTVLMEAPRECRHIKAIADGYDPSSPCYEGSSLREDAFDLPPMPYTGPDAAWPLADSKPTNPKDQIAGSKLDLHLVPSSMKAYAALAFTEGATKYGSTNWRVAGVRASVYMSAHDRHVEKYWNGEWADPATGVPHLASAMSCLAIILDAKLAGKLTDDRPPSVDYAALVEELAVISNRLKVMHAHITPRHYTIADTQS